MRWTRGRIHGHVATIRTTGTHVTRWTHLLLLRIGWPHHAMRHRTRTTEWLIRVHHLILKLLQWIGSVHKFGEKILLQLPQLCQLFFPMSSLLWR